MSTLLPVVPPETEPSSTLETGLLADEVIPFGASDADDAGKEGADAETDGCHTENNSLPRLVVVK